MVLTGDKVYQQYHPMLSETNPKYVVPNPKRFGQQLYLSGALPTAENIVPIVIDVSIDLCGGSALDNLLFLKRLFQIVLDPNIATSLRPAKLDEVNQLMVWFSIDLSSHCDVVIGSLASAISSFLASGDTSSLQLMIDWLHSVELKNSTSDGSKIKDSDTSGSIWDWFGYAKSESGNSDKHTPKELKSLQALLNKANITDIPSSSDFDTFLKFLMSSAERQIITKSQTKISLNGRELSSFGPATFSLDDLQMLSLLEIERSIVLASIIAPLYTIEITDFNVSWQDYAWAVAVSSGILGKVAQSDGSQKRLNIDAQLAMFSDNRLVQSWNTGIDENSIPKVSFSTIIYLFWISLNSQYTLSVNLGCCNSNI